MRIGFVTCVSLGLECLEEIYKVGGTVDILFTLKDDQAVTKSGRVWLDEIAAEYEIPLAKVRHISDDEAVAAIREADLDWLFVVGWSQIARAETLASVKRGCIGIHPTLLPEGRGRAPIPWAIIKGLDVTGVTMFKLDEGVDSGQILAQQRIPLDGDETATSLYEKVGAAHKELIRAIVPDLLHDRINLVSQDDSKATYWPGRKPEDGRIRAEMTVREVDRLVRGVTHPYPGAFVMKGPSTRDVIWAGSPTQASEHAPLDLADGLYWPHHVERQVSS